MIKSVIFDWNGTLLADTRSAVFAVNKICEKYNKPSFTLNDYREIMDIPVKKIYLKHGFTQKELKKFGSDLQMTFLKYYEPLAGKARLRRGARHTLNWLMNAGIDIVLISNHLQKNIEKQLKRLKIDGFFSHVYANNNHNNVIYQRFKAKKMAEYIQYRGYKKNEVINVGDAPEEIQMARKCGVMSVAITDGFYSNRRLKDEKPDYIITNMMRLINIIERENKKNKY